MIMALEIEGFEINNTFVVEELQLKFLNPKRTQTGCMLYVKTRDANTSNG